jgi:N-acetylglucosamine-6-phosphate deacetylase
MVKHIYTAQNIFTGNGWLQQHAVVTDGKKIVDVRPIVKTDTALAMQHLGDVLLVPAFIDAQVYGAHEKLFALYPGPDALHKLVQYCEAGGAALCQPTVATNTYETIFACIDAVRQYWQQGGSGVHGLHIEGPWINPLKRGAHVAALVHRPTAAQVKVLHLLPRWWMLPLLS